MTDAERKHEEIAVKALRSCLERVPFVKVRSIESRWGGRETGPDLWVDIMLPEGRRRLAVTIKANGESRFARLAARELSLYRRAAPEGYAIFMAPYVSPKSAEICADEGVGFLDLAGNCRLCFGQVYIEQQGKPNVFVRRQGPRSLYSPKAARVLRVLLTAPRRVWKTEALAEEAKVSLGQVSKIKRLLNDRELIDEARVGFSLREPESLLREWGRNYTYKKNRVRDFFSLSKIFEVEAELDGVCRREGIRYALTGFSAAARLAPAVRSQRVFAYVEDARGDVASLLGLKEVPSGANVSLLTPYDEGVFYGAREIGGIQVASAIQVYLDLVGFRGRGEEAAEVVVEEVIRPAW